ncbi:MAG: Rrf2 family transcriptional regulator [Nitrososphaerota archaeon]|nr:Rrf2 family transcriptional regulator [Nitrososphaerota archaeon]
MQLNVTTDYGIRVILYLAQKNGVASSSEICEKMGIPPSYIHKIAKTLKKAGMIREIRGSKGGFELKKNPNSLSVLAIVNAFEKTINISKCLEKDKFCSKDIPLFLGVRELYAEIQAELHNRLDVKISNFLNDGDC